MGEIINASKNVPGKFTEIRNLPNSREKTVIISNKNLLIAHSTGDDVGITNQENMYDSAHDLT
jgi:hypothetical protein